MEIINHKNENYIKTETGYRKILASTNTSLKLPQIPQDFIKKFIESYNAGKVIEEVEVEMEIVYTDTIVGTGDGEYQERYKTIKINPDNTISIHVVKDTFTREELQFFKGSSGNHLEWIFERLVHKHGENPNYDYMIKLKELSNWIKEHL